MPDAHLDAEPIQRLPLLVDAGPAQARQSHPRPNDEWRLVARAAAAQMQAAATTPDIPAGGHPVRLPPRSFAALTLPKACARGFFSHPADLTERNCLRRLVVFCPEAASSRRSGTRFRLPGGTVGSYPVQGSQENVQGRVPISVQHQTTVG